MIEVDVAVLRPKGLDSSRGSGARACSVHQGSAFRRCLV